MSRLLEQKLYQVLHAPLVDVGVPLIQRVCMNRKVRDVLCLIMGFITLLPIPLYRI